MAVDVGSAKGYLDLDISGFLSGLRTAQSEADSATKNMATKVGGNLQAVGKSLTSVGTTLTKTVTLPVAGAGAAIVKVSSDFESAMSKVAAISGAAGDDLERLNQKAQEMGASTKFSATEAAEAFTYMAMAGWKTEDMLAGIDGIMSLAAADGLDLATTSDIVTDALTAFGLGAEDSAHFADVLAKASSSANTNVSMLGESFKYVAPVAGALGYSAEDIAVALGLMANAGIKGSQGGTALRASLSRLIKPTDDAAAVMEEYGISLTNTDGSMKTFAEVMTMLRTNLGDLTEAEQAQVAATLFGQEAMSGMLAIINTSDKDFESLTNQINNADGAAKQMADTMLDNLSGQVTILKSALEGLALQFGEILLPYLKKFITWLQELTEKLQKMTPEQKEQVVRWAAIGAVIGPVILILGKLATSLGGIFTLLGKAPGMINLFANGIAKITGATLPASTGAVTFGTSLKALGTSLAGVIGPILAVVATIAVLAAAFVSLWKNNEDFRNKITAIWEEIKATFDRLGQGIVDRLNRLGFDFESIGEVFKAIWQGFCDYLAPYFEFVFNKISIIFDTFVDVFFGIWDFFHALFTGDWEGCWEAILSIFSSVWDGIKQSFINWWNYFKGTWNTVLGWFGTSWDEFWTNTKNFFTNTWNSIWNGLKTGATNAWEGVKSVFSKVTTFFGDTFKAAWEKVKGVFTAGGKIFEGIKDSIVSVFKTVVNGLIDGINWVIKQPFEGLNGVLDKIASIEILGAKPFGWLTWRAPVPQIPYLAEGAVLPPNNPFLAVVGDQRRGVNVEAPLSTIQEAVFLVFNEFAREIIALQRVSVGVLSEIRDDVGYVSYHGFKNPDDKRDKFNNSGKSNDDSGNGDTYNFYSPKALDEIEAAKQMKKAKRDLAEGY